MRSLKHIYSELLGLQDPYKNSELKASKHNVTHREPLFPIQFRTHSSIRNLLIDDYIHIFSSKLYWADYSFDG